MKKYKIAITDDHLLFAEGISNLIVSKPDMELAFIAASAFELKLPLFSCDNIFSSVASINFLHVQL